MITYYFTVIYLMNLTMYHYNVLKPVSTLSLAIRLYMNSTKIMVYCNELKRRSSNNKYKRINNVSDCLTLLKEIMIIMPYETH